MFEAIAEALPDPVGTVIRQFLDPAMTDQVLNLLGNNGQFFDTLLHNTVTATILHGSEKFNVIPSEVAVEVLGRLPPSYGPDDLIDELRSVIGNEPEIEVLRYDPGPPEPDMGLFDTLASILRDADPGGVPIPQLLPASTDGRFFSAAGYPDLWLFADETASRSQLLSDASRCR